jgi:hypothetical protein
MSEEGRSSHWFTLLYTDFLLRDVFGKMVPGLVVLLSLLVVAGIGDLDTKALAFDWWSWVFVIGLAWTFGFAVQSVGEALGIIRYTPPTAVTGSSSTRRERLAAWSRRVGARVSWRPARGEDEHFRAAYRELMQVTACCSADVRRHHERFIVIKEASGNAGCSFLLALALLGVNRLFPWPGWSGLALTVYGLALLRMHHRAVWRQQWFQDICLTNDDRATHEQ